MGFLPDFTLPSKSDITVRLREATVSDAIDFSEIDPDCEEEATSQFLERMQAREKYTDPRLWTGEDRRYALFMYLLNTTKDRGIVLTYDCTACDRKHTVEVPFSGIIDEYTGMDGKPFRDLIHEGHAVVVHPLLGRDLETIEKVRISIRDMEQESRGRHVARKKRAQLAMMQILCCIDIPALEGETETGRRPNVEKFLLDMTASEFREFMGKFATAIESMRHGLNMEYEGNQLILVTPAVQCPDTPDAPGVSLRYPFRAIEYIPHI